MTAGGSAVVRRQLGARLHALREAAGKSLADVADAGLGSKAKISKIETGKSPVKIPDVRTLCWFYGADGATTDALAALAPGTQQPDWWETYSNVVVPDWFGLYVGLEESAAGLRCFDPVLIHGVLQTEDYARGVIGCEDGLEPEVIDQRVAFRMNRQQRVLRRSSTLSVVLGQAALSLIVGSPDVMTAQLEHLRRLGRGGQVAINILPWTAGPYPMLGSFTILDFVESDDPRVVYVEFSMGARYVEQPSQVAEYERVFQMLTKRSIPIEEWSP